jgi:hypothetical protein
MDPSVAARVIGVGRTSRGWRRHRRDRRSAPPGSVLRIALPTLRLALRGRYLEARRQDPAAAVVAAEELATVGRIRVRLARQGWWN